MPPWPSPGWLEPGVASLMSVGLGQARPSRRGWLCAGGRVSGLLMGLGHPALLPGDWTRLGLFPGSPLSHSPPRPGPPARCSLPPVSLAGRSLGLPEKPRAC